MYSNKITSPIEYLSLIMVVSFFIFHNIYLVIAGVCLSIYIINKNYIKKIIEYSKNILADKVNNSTKKDFTSQKPIKKESILSLVESIEKYGYIPSIDKGDNKNMHEI